MYLLVKVFFYKINLILGMLLMLINSILSVNFDV